jgi:hypothetical protein
VTSERCLYDDEEETKTTTLLEVDETIRLLCLSPSLTSLHLSSLSQCLECATDTVISESRVESPTALK